MQNNPIFIILIYAVLIVLLWVLFIRPQKKQRQAKEQLMDSLEVNDKITTIGGIFGKITKVKEDTLMIRVANGVEIEILKSAVSASDKQERLEKQAKAAEKKD